MGCSTTRLEVPSEENAIKNGEDLLLYNEHELNEIFKAHKDVAKGDELSKKRLKKLTKNLLLGYAKDNSDPKINGFYESLAKGENFNVKELLLIAVLLCKGDAQTKANLLFDLYDDNSISTVSKNDISSMLDSLFDMAINKLTKLAVASNSDNVYDSRSFAGYIEKLKAGQKPAKELILEGVSSGQAFIMNGNFVEWFKKEGNDEWLTSSGLRSKLRKLGKKELKGLKSA